MTGCRPEDKREFESLQPATEDNVNFTKITAEDLSNEMKRAVWPVTILIGVEATLGIIGNILIIIIYTLRYSRCNFKYFVLCMALIDITSCMTTLPGEMFSQMHWYNYKHDWICKIKSYFNVFTVWSSAFALLLLAYDRYRKICRPLEWQIQPYWALRSCVVTVSISGIISVPVFILWGKQSYIYERDGQNITVTICEKSGFYADGIYPFLFIVSAYMIPIVFMICITYILNFLIARAIFTKIPGAQKAYETPLHLRNSNNNTSGDGYNFRHSIRRHSDVLSSGTGQLVDRRISTSMDISQTNKYSSIQIDKSLHQHRTLTELNGYTYNPNYCALENHESGGSLTNGRETAKQGDPNETYELKRLTSCSSSDSSGSIIFKHKKKRYLSPSCILQGPSARRRISEAERSDLMIEDDHSCAKHDVRAIRLKRKTEIMLILTTVFTITIIIYLVLVSMVASKESILKELSKSDKVVFFLFWRFYFINCVINPVLYGLMDPRFRNGLKEIVCVKTSVRKRSSKFAATQVTLV